MSRKITIDTTEALGCRKCNRVDAPTFRHHKGNDAYFAPFNKGIAKNYRRFYHSVRLCFECHMKIHYLYQLELSGWLNKTAAGAKLMREKLIGLCDRWLAGLVHDQPIPQWFRDGFIRSFDEWLKEKPETG